MYTLSAPKMYVDTEIQIIISIPSKVNILLFPFFIQSYQGIGKYCIFVFPPNLMKLIIQFESLYTYFSSLSDCIYLLYVLYINKL